jgi:hypothetical protein
MAARGPKKKAAGVAGGQLTGRHYKERNQIRPTIWAPRAVPEDRLSSILGIDC